MEFLMPFTKTRTQKEQTAATKKEEYRNTIQNEYGETSQTSSDILPDLSASMSTITNTPSNSNGAEQTYIVTANIIPNWNSIKAVSTTVPKLERKTLEPVTSNEASSQTSVPICVSQSPITSQSNTENVPHSKVCISSSVDTLSKVNSTYQSIIAAQKRPPTTNTSIVLPTKKCCTSEIPPDPQEIEDANVNFFKSLLPDMRQMTAKQKRKFKMGIYELVNNILENE